MDFKSSDEPSKSVHLNYHVKQNSSRAKSHFPETVELVKIRKCNVEDIMSMEMENEQKLRKRSKRISIDCSIVSQLEVLEDTVKNTLNEIKTKSGTTSDTEESTQSSSKDEDMKFDSQIMCMSKTGSNKDFEQNNCAKIQYSCICGMVGHQDRFKKLLSRSTKKKPSAPNYTIKPPARESGDCHCKKTNIETFRIPTYSSKKKHQHAKPTKSSKYDSGDESEATDVTPVLTQKSSSLVSLHKKSTMYNIHNRSKSCSPETILNIFSRSASKTSMKPSQSKENVEAREMVDRCIVELQKLSKYLKSQPLVPQPVKPQSNNTPKKVVLPNEKAGPETYSLGNDGKGKALNDNDSKLVICIKGNKEEKDVNIVIKQCPNCKTCFKSPPNNVITDMDQSIQEILSILDNDGIKRAAQQQKTTPVTYTTQYVDDISTTWSRKEHQEPINQVKIDKNGQFCLSTEDGKEFLISIGVKRKSEECLTEGVDGANCKFNSCNPLKSFVCSPDLCKRQDTKTFPVSSKICSSLDFDVTMVDTKLRNKGIDHPNPNIVVCLREIGINNLLLASRPAKCCRKIVLNQRLKKSLPYAPSLRSLPLDERDVQIIKNKVRKKLKKQALKTSSYNVYYMQEETNKGQCEKLKYYINLVNDEPDLVNNNKIVMCLFATYSDFFNYYIYLDDGPARNFSIFNVMFFEIKKYAQEKPSNSANNNAKILNNYRDQRSKNSYVYLKSKLQKYCQKQNSYSSSQRSSKVILGGVRSEEQKLVIVEVNPDSCDPSFIEGVSQTIEPNCQVVKEISKEPSQSLKEFTEILARPNVDFHMDNSSVSIHFNREWSNQTNGSTISEIYKPVTKKKKKKAKYCLSRSKSDCSLSKLDGQQTFKKRNFKISTLSLEINGLQESSSHLIHHYINNLWYREFINELYKDDYNNSEDNTSRVESWNSYIIGQMSPKNNNLVIEYYKSSGLYSSVPSQPNVDAFNEDYERIRENKVIKVQEIQTDNVETYSNVFIQRQKSEMFLLDCISSRTLDHLEYNECYKKSQKKSCKHKRLIKQLYGGCNDYFSQWGHGDQSSQMSSPTESHYSCSTMHSSSTISNDLLAHKYRKRRKNMTSLLRHYLELIDHGELNQEYWIYHNNSQAFFRSARSIFKRSTNDLKSKSVTVAYSKPGNYMTLDSIDDFHLLCQKCGRYISTNKDLPCLSLSNFCTCKSNDVSKKKESMEDFELNNVVIVAPAHRKADKGKDILAPSPEITERRNTASAENVSTVGGNKDQTASEPINNVNLDAEKPPSDGPEASANRPSVSGDEPRPKIFKGLKEEDKFYLGTETVAETQKPSVGDTRKALEDRDDESDMEDSKEKLLRETPVRRNSGVKKKDKSVSLITGNIYEATQTNPNTPTTDTSTQPEPKPEAKPEPEPQQRPPVADKSTMKICISSTPQSGSTDKFVACSSKTTQTLCKCRPAKEACVHCVDYARAIQNQPGTNERSCGQDSRSPSETLMRICVLPTFMKKKSKPQTGSQVCPCCNSKLTPETKAKLQKFIEQLKKNPDEKEAVIVSQMSGNVKLRKSTPSTSAQSEAKPVDKKTPHPVAKDSLKSTSKQSSYYDNLSAQAFLDHLFEMASFSPTTDESCQSDIDFECEEMTHSRTDSKYKREKRKYKDVLYALTKMQKIEARKKSSHDNSTTMGCFVVKDKNLILVHKKK